MHIKQIVPLLGSLALLGVPQTQAAFTKVADFEAGLNGAVLGSTANPANGDTGIGAIAVVDDPFASGNKVIELKPGTFLNGTGGQNTWFTIPIPAVTGTGTIYGRYAKETDVVSPVWGTTPAATPASYGDFSQVFGHATDSILIVYDGTGYKTTNFALAPRTWYEFWFVFDQPSNKYDLYIRGGEYTAITKIYSQATFRSKGTEPQKFFYARSTVGSLTAPAAVDDVYYDDIYIDTTGANLTTPGSSSGGGTGGEQTDDGPVVIGTGDIVNIATRGLVGTGDNVMIGGFVIQQDRRRVLIRGVGPTLSTFGLAGALANPKITLLRGETVVATNDDWGSASNLSRITATSSAVGAFPLVAGSADAAILLTLDAGSYTVKLEGVGGTTGVGLIEVYQAK